MLHKLQEKWENDRSDLLFVHLCNPGEPRPGMPALLQGLKSYLLRASHQSPEQCLQQFQIRIGLTPHQVRATCVTVSRLSRGVVFPGASLRVHLSAGSPFHCYHPEPKKLSQLWSHPAAPASKWGLIPRKPWKDTEECLAHSTPFTQGLDWEELSLHTVIYSTHSVGVYILYTVEFILCMCKLCIHLCINRLGQIILHDF